MKNNRDALIRNALTADEGTRAHNATLKASRALVAFQSTAAAKERFRKEKDDEIKAFATAKRSESPLLNAGAAYQLALTELWNEADQETYGSRSMDDIFQ